MADLPDGCVDLVLVDPPYGTTACSWDAVIPFEPMWAQVKRVLKPTGAAVFTASQPFTSALVMSNVKAFAHAWVWNKRFAANFVQAKRQPMKDHEDVLVFCTTGKQPRYFPQKTLREKPIQVGGNNPTKGIPIAQTVASDAFGAKRKSYHDKHPTTVTSLDFSARFEPERGLHPTQKPVGLMEYLIHTYSRPGETVLDFAMGSGSAGVAAVNTFRSFIGIEMDEDHFATASARIKKFEAAARIESDEIGGMV